MKKNEEIIAYNTKQRLVIYKLALKLLKTDIENPNCSIGGLCYYIREAVSLIHMNNPQWVGVPYINFDDNDNGNGDIQYPELMKHKPDEDERYCYSFWFDRHKSDGGITRVQILEDIISVMQKKVKKDVTFKIVFTYK